jgi:predicted ATPase/DNA-binding SARP family transcriptional activator
LQVWGADGRPVDFGGGQPRTLLARLALSPGKPVAVDDLVESLWGDAPPTGVANALQSVVSRLRRGLQDGLASEPRGRSEHGLVESRHSGYLLAIDASDVDAVQFERTALDGREQLRAGDAAAAHGALSEALALWRGPVLSDVGTAGFVVPVAARLEEQRLATVEDRVEAAILLGRASDVIPELETLADSHPLRERISGLLIRALARTGRQADALSAYERIRARLAEDLGLDPSRELVQLHLSVLRGELEEGGGQRPASTREEMTWTPGKHALPTRLTSFIGRDDDIAALTGALEKIRLVTLHGPGGAGKTRLAAEAARHLADRGGELGADGVWFVELAPVGEPADVAPAVLSALGLREIVHTKPEGLRPLEARMAGDRLMEALGDKNAVIVLDNCEHLVGAVAELANALLTHCPDLRVVATSREPLGVEGEKLYPVGPLPLPGNDDAHDPGRAGEYAAVRLFTERATAVSPGFALDHSTVRPVVEICRRLDGMPLAIELAAARTRALSAAQIAARLNDRFRLLTNGGRTALPRHQTLHAVVEWSWELLDKPERTLLGRLSVFSGGASLDAVERICSGGDVSREDVLDVIASLVDKSLVEASASDALDGEVRYHLLETVKAFAAERLADAGDVQEVSGAHATYFRDLLERAEPHLRRSEQVVWLQRLAQDYDNLLSGLRWAIDRREVALAVRMAAVLGYFWLLRGGIREAGSWLREVVALPAEAPLSRHALVHLYAGAACVGSDGVPAMIRSLARARIAARRAAPDPGFPVRAVIEGAWSSLADGRPEARDGLVMAQESTDQWVRGMGFLMGMFMASAEGDVGGRDRDLTAAMAEFGAIGDRMGMGLALRMKAAFLGQQGDHGAAVRALDEALQMARALESAEDVPTMQAELGRMMIDLGDHAGARRALGEAMAGGQRGGVVEAIVLAHNGLGWLAYRDGDIELARDHFRHLRSVLPAPQLEEAVIIADHAYAELADGECGAAATIISDAVGALFRGVKHRHPGAPDRTSAAQLTQVLAALAAARGEHSEAARLLGVSTFLRGLPDLGSAERAATERDARQELGPPETRHRHEDKVRDLHDGLGHHSQSSGKARAIQDRTRDEGTQDLPTDLDRAHIVAHGYSQHVLLCGRDTAQDIPTPRWCR